MPLLNAFWSDQSVVVPGGAGFIGSYVVDTLVAHGARVTVIDDLSSGSWQRLAALGGNITRVDADLTTTDLAPHFSGAHAVLNLAGRAPGLSLDKHRHDTLYRDNLRIADAVLDAALTARVPRLLVISSSCVYPDDAPVPTPELPLHDSEPERANRGYGLAKRAIEARATAAHGPTTAITIARPFNACGPRDQATGPGAHVIPSLLEKILDPSLDEILVWGSGKQTRSFIDARDLAAALLLLTEHHPQPDPVNIGSSEEIPMHQLVHTLMQLARVEKPIRFDHSKPEGAPRKACSPAKLTRLTRFQPQFSLARSLTDIVTARI